MHNRDDDSVPLVNFGEWEIDVFDDDTNDWDTTVSCDVEIVGFLALTLEASMGGWYDDDAKDDADEKLIYTWGVTSNFDCRDFFDLAYGNCASLEEGCAFAVDFVTKLAAELLAKSEAAKAAGIAACAGAKPASRPWRPAEPE